MLVLVILVILTLIMFYQWNYEHMSGVYDQLYAKDIQDTNLTDDAWNHMWMDSYSGRIPRRYRQSYPLFISY